MAMVFCMRDVAMKSIRELIGAAAKDMSQFCYCAGSTCSGCEENTEKIFNCGAIFAIRLAKEKGWLKHNWQCLQWERTEEREIYLNHKSACTCGLSEVEELVKC
jgi:hypothetical protein